jgi:hypothetical protein
MKSIYKAICMIATIGTLFAVGVFYLCTHGIEEDGWTACVMMSSSTTPMDSDLVGRTFPIDGMSSVRVTTISKILNSDDSVESYRIHADVLCRRKHWFSMDHQEFRYVCLVSSQEVHDFLRAKTFLPEHAVSHISGTDNLLP